MLFNCSSKITSITMFRDCTAVTLLERLHSFRHQEYFEGRIYYSVTTVTSPTHRNLNMKPK